jgi:hypothetical protein
VNLEIEINRLSLAQTQTNAILDVHAVIIGNLLPEFRANTSAVARLQAALEVLLDTAKAERNDAYVSAAHEHAQKFLRLLPDH